MHQHWSEQYVGMPYTSSFNCLDLVILIQKETFDRTLHIPNKTKPYSEMIEDHVGDFVDVNTIDHEPEDGDLVLMETVSRQLHLGVFFKLNLTDEYVIHNNTESSGTVITPINRIHIQNIKVKGVYKWL